MHPYAIEQVAGSKARELMRDADAARLAAQMPPQPLPRRGLGIVERFTRRVQRRRLRDVAC